MIMWLLLAYNYLLTLFESHLAQKKNLKLNWTSKDGMMTDPSSCSPGAFCVWPVSQ